MTRFAVAHRIAVFVLVFGVVVAGATAYLLLPREAAPDIVFPNILVTVPYPGVAPNDMELLVTTPLERKLGEVRDLDVMTSTSAEGAAVINLQFTPKVPITEALQRVRDKVGEARADLPHDTEEPVIKEIAFSDFPILVVTLAGDVDLQRLKHIAEGLEDEVERIDGVSDARVVGGLERELQVRVDPRMLAHLGVTLNEVGDAIANENVNVPGGSVDTGAIRYNVRVPAELDSAHGLEQIVVKTVAGEPISITRLARITDGFATPTSRSRLDGKPSVSLTIMKRAGGNLVGIVDEVKELVAARRAAFPPGVEVAFLADASVEVRRFVRELENNILSGLILVLLVLFLFLGARNSLFVALAIPLSMLIAFGIIAALGMTLNMVVLFSLILALGMLVDNAIVVVENIYRHSEMGKDRVTAALDGTAEVTWPVITSTITTLCAFAPLMFWPGLMGEFMGYLPLTLIITLSCSLFVALVINPVVCATFLREGSKGAASPSHADDVESPAAPREALFIRGYRGLLRWSLSHRLIVAALAIATLMGTFSLYGRFGHGVEFFPETTPRKVFVNINAPEGTRLDTSDALARQVEGLLDGEPNVTRHATDIGAGSAMDPSSTGVPHKTRLTVEFQEVADLVEDPRATIARMRRHLGDVIAGADTEIKKEDMGPPAGPPINIELSGEDYEQLALQAEAVKRAIRGVPGLANLRDDAPEGRPELQVRVDRSKLRRFDLKSTRAVANVVRTAVFGRVASKLRDGIDEHDIRVQLDDRWRDDLTQIGDLEIDGEKGARVPLRLVADLEPLPGSGVIRHKDERRVVTVSAEVEERNAAEALAEVQGILAKDPPAGADLSYTGENEDQAEAQAFLAKAGMAALLLITLVLVTQFNSLLQPMIIVISVVLSLIGVLSGLMLTATPFGIVMTGIGVISLAGVVVNNAILLIDYTNILRRRGEGMRAAVVEAGATRLRPVLLTAVTTILGLLPMATGVGFDFIAMELQVGGQSAEMWSPMAIAVIFGLAASTVLTLVVVPTFYSLFEGIKAWLGARLAPRPRLRAVLTVAVVALLVHVAVSAISAMVMAQGGGA